MKTKERIVLVIALAALTVLFFHKTFRFGFVPFPADALVSDFQPWRSTSYLGYGAGGIPNKAQYPDTIRQIYPWKSLVVESLKRGKLPLWNPYNFSGAPLLANFQSAALYPLNFFYVLLPQIDAWTILIMLQPLLATLFTYLYSRKVGMGYPGSWLASLSYGFCGYMAVWLEYNTVGHVILWLPLMLLATEHIKEKPTVFWLGALTFAHAASIFAGHPQIYVYTALFSTAYMLSRVPRSRWGLTIFFSALGAGVAAIQIIPGVELVANAARSPHDVHNLLTKILIQPWQLLSLPFPNFFGNPATRTYWPADTFIGKVTTIGLVPLFFLPSAYRRKDMVTKWYMYAAIATGVLITNNPIAQILYRLPIPLVSSSSPTLMAFVFSFSLAMLCGLGLDFWMSDKHSVKKIFRRTLELIGIFFLLYVSSKLPIFPNLSAQAGVTNRALLYGALLSIATMALFWIAVKFPKYRSHAIVVLLIVHTLDLFVFFNRFNPFVPKALVFPQHAIFTFLQDKSPDRYWGYGTATIPANFASQYHVFSPEGYDPLFPISYGQFFYSYRRALYNSFNNATRSDAAIQSNFGDGGLTDINKQNLLNALSVRYILDRVENGSGPQIYPPSVYKPIVSLQDWNIYENIDAAPRTYFAQRVYVAPNARAFNDIIVDQSYDPAHTVILTVPPRIPIPSNVNGTARIRTYLPEYVEITTESTTAGMLVLTDTYYPGWLASIDNKPTTIYPANWALRAVAIPAGTHTVTMEYFPDSIVWGSIVSMVSFILSVVSLLLVRNKK